VKLYFHEIKPPSFQQKSCESINFLDILVIHCYNGTQRCRVLSYCGSLCRTTEALPLGRALFVIPKGELIMAVSYKKLWKLLIDKDIKKKDLSTRAGVSPATITKMGKGGHVTTEVLVKICAALN
jgi:DNA-binding Xre family transcriptional regulator